MAAEIEEVVVHAHLVELEQLLPDLGDRALHLVAGSHVRRLPLARPRRRGAAVPFVEAGSEDTISASSESGCRARLARTVTRPSSTIVERLGSEQRSPGRAASGSISAPGVTVSVKG